MTDLLKNSPVRTGELTAKVWHHFGQGYTKLTQVRAATGWADLNTADMVVMGEWPSTGNELHGFEVKVSRADWLNEVKNPHKNDSVKSYCDRWWLVIADEGMVRIGELPEDWGMMAFVGHNKKLKIVKKAPKLEAQPMDNLFVASLLRHNDKEMIPLDVHKDLLRDAAREAAALEKRKSADLFEFVRTLVKSYGIEVKEDRQHDYTKAGRTKAFKRWEAQIKSTYLGSMDAQTLADMLRRIQAYDSLRSDVQIINKRLLEMLAKSEAANDPEQVKPWMEWALKHCSAFLRQSSSH